MHISKAFLTAMIFGLTLGAPLKSYASCDPTHLEIAKAYADQAITTPDVQAMVDSMWIPIVEKLEQTGLKITDLQKARIKSAYSNDLRGQVKLIFLQQSKTMAKVFTLEELKALGVPLKNNAACMAERLEAAKAYVEEYNANVDMQAIIDAVLLEAEKKLNASEYELTKRQKSELMGLISNEIDGMLKEVRLQEAQFVAEIYTENEIIALRNFDRSKEGKAILQKLPQIAAKTASLKMDMMSDLSARMLPKVLRILDSKK